jgi:uncharacterized pyridoxamine 5'-phosphate oxidase family protein
MQEKVLKFLKENPGQYLATIGEDNRPKIRPFQFMLEKDNKLYFCTSNEKRVFSDLEKNPYAELCVMNNKMEWIRIAGGVKFSKDREIKKEIIENNPLVKGIYRDCDNPVFEVFFIENSRISISCINEVIFEEQL